MVATEADDLPGHCLSRLAPYFAQVASGKINGHALPTAIQVADDVIVVDANHRCAYPAMALAIEKLGALTPKTGVALAAVTHSQHCGAAGYHVEALAKQGLIGLMFPKRLPHGAARGECSVQIQSPLRRRASKKTLVIDMSLSKVARGKIPISSQ